MNYIYNYYNSFCNNTKKKFARNFQFYNMKSFNNVKQNYTFITIVKTLAVNMDRT